MPSNGNRGPGIISTKASARRGELRSIDNIGRQMVPRARLRPQPGLREFHAHSWLLLRTWCTSSTGRRCHNAHYDIRISPVDITIDRTLLSACCQGWPFKNTVQMSYPEVPQRKNRSNIFDQNYHDINFGLKNCRQMQPRPRIKHWLGEVNCAA